MHRFAGDRALNVKPDEGVSPNEINDRRNLFGANKVTHILDYSRAQIFLPVVSVCVRARTRVASSVRASLLFARLFLCWSSVSLRVYVFVCQCICLYVGVCGCVRVFACQYGIWQYRSIGTHTRCIRVHMTIQTARDRSTYPALTWACVNECTTHPQHLSSRLQLLTVIDS